MRKSEGNCIFGSPVNIFSFVMILLETILNLVCHLFINIFINIVFQKVARMLFSPNQRSSQGSTTELAQIIHPNNDSKWVTPTPKELSIDIP